MGSSNTTDTTTFGLDSLIPVLTFTKTLSQDVAILSKGGNYTTVVGLYGAQEVTSKYKGAGGTTFLSIPQLTIYFLMILGFNCA